MTTLTVVRPGLLTTVQDAGRWGQQHAGVPVAGPMDWYSHRLANALVGNAPDEAVLEATLIGPELAADGDALVAVAGGEFELFVDSAAVAMHAPITLRRGQSLRFGRRGAGARAYVAVAGGLRVSSVFGSRSMSLISKLGPFGGRALRPGDQLPLGLERGFGTVPPTRALRLPRGGTRLRVIRGPHDDQFTAAALRALESERFTVTTESNRMGYRLGGPSLDHVDDVPMLSDATPMGSIQVPPSGAPILLMADRQTTGGYPKIATVITADLPLAGQLAPGDWIEFEVCNTDQAVGALRRRMEGLTGRRAERHR